MKIQSTAALIAVTLATTLVASQAQEEQRPAGEGRRPMSPIVAALDANKDGAIDKDEMEKAVAALKTLDKDNDGKLSAEEIRPARREGGRQGQPNN